MKENFSFKRLGTLPLFEELIPVVLNFTEYDWVSYRERKKRGGIAAENTDTIPIIYNPKQSSTDLQYHDLFGVMEQHLNRMKELASDIFGEVSVRQAMLTRLAAGGQIKRHMDKGPITARSHRVHLCVKTNDSCLFTVGNETIHIPQGEVWAIDNVGKYHSVCNYGNSERIHLIVDFIDEENKRQQTIPRHRKQ